MTRNDGDDREFGDPTRSALSVGVSDPDRTKDADPEDSTFDETGAFHSDGNPPPADAPSVPGYRISVEIARGGMGRVYAAVELTLRREVAIKTLLTGRGADRFVTEAEITARLPHPNIPPVHALGRLADGTPYLAMKLVRGRTLAELLKQRASPGAELPRFIQIFEQIAQAVGFAHSQGVVHRDLKPLNVMVGAFGEVQVMDWGLAKVLAGHEAQPSAPASTADDADQALTAAGQVMGTPGYMPPEQARGEPVDARADVFSLGAMLAAILTGRPAFVGTTARETIEKAASGDLADVLTRLSTCGADEDLVAVAKRCLAASPGDRPANAQVVAESIAAYRAGVDARLRQAETAAAEAVIREAEQRKRRRVLFSASASVIIALTAGLAASLWQRNLAVKRLNQVEYGNELLASVFENLDMRAVKKTGEPLEAALAKKLTEAGARLDGHAIGDSRVFAKLQNQLGVSLLSLGFAKEATASFEKAVDALNETLGPTHEESISSLCNLAGGLQADGRINQALPLFEEALALSKANLGADHPQTAACANNLAMGLLAVGRFDRALPLLEELLELRKASLGLNHQKTITSMKNFAGGLKEVGKTDLALAGFEEALALSKANLGFDHPDTLDCMSSVGAALLDAGQIERAILVFEESLKISKSKLGSEHTDTLTNMNNLAVALEAAGQSERALPLLEHVVTHRKGKLGLDHPDTLAGMSSLGGVLESLGQTVRAVSLYEEALKLQKATLGIDHPSTLMSMNNLASGLAASGSYDQALPVYEETLRLRKTKLGIGHPDTLVSMNNLAAAYWKTKRLDQSVPLFEEALRLSEQMLGRTHPTTQTTVANLGVNYKDAGRLKDAIPLLEESHAAAKAHPSLHWVAEQLSRALEANEDYVRLSDLLLQRLEDSRQSLPKESPQLASLLAYTGDIKLKLNQSAEAEPPLQECLAIRQKSAPDIWTTFNTQSTLGAALLGRKKYADAEPMLLKGYEGMKQREKTIPPQVKNQRLGESIDRLIELYTATNKPEEVKKWKAEREKYAKPAAPAKK